MVKTSLPGAQVRFPGWGTRILHATPRGQRNKLVANKAEDIQQEGSQKMAKVIDPGILDWFKKGARTKRTLIEREKIERSLHLWSHCINEAKV